MKLLLFLQQCCCLLHYSKTYRTDLASTVLFLTGSGQYSNAFSWWSDTWTSAGQASQKAGSALFRGMKDLACLQVECCSPAWRPADYEKLQSLLSEHLVGQHIAQDMVVRALRGHARNKSPSKPLVLSLHGWTGSGKNFVSQFIADSFYTRGLASKFVHLFIATLHFPNQGDVILYKDNLRSWIRGNGSACQQNVFIFDEVDKMPVGVLDGIKPFLDHYEAIDGVDYRRNIFIFLSNTGGKEITESALATWKAGRERQQIAFKDLEPLIAAGAFNEQGGLQYSRMIEKSLVDVFVPFLPLERQHVKICIRNELKRRGIVEEEQVVERVAEELTYWPKELNLYSSSGCKRIAQKIDLVVEEMEEIVEAKQEL